MKNIWIKTPGRTGSHIIIDYFERYHGAHRRWFQDLTARQPLDPRLCNVVHDHLHWSKNFPNKYVYAQMIKPSTVVLFSLRKDRVAQTMSHFIALECGSWTHTEPNIQRPDQFYICPEEFEKYILAVIKWETYIPRGAERIYFEDDILNTLKRKYPARSIKNNSLQRIVSRATPWNKHELVLNYNELADTFKHYNES